MSGARVRRGLTPARQPAGRSALSPPRRCDVAAHRAAACCYQTPPVRNTSPASALPQPLAQQADRRATVRRALGRRHRLEPGEGLPKRECYPCTETIDELEPLPRPSARRPRVHGRDRDADCATRGRPRRDDRPARPALHQAANGRPIHLLRLFALDGWIGLLARPRMQQESIVRETLSANSIAEHICPQRHRRRHPDMGQRHDGRLARAAN